MTAVRSLTLFFAWTCCISVHFVHAQKEFDVKCDHDTTVCVCPESADVCNFVLSIRETQTFTRYLSDDVRLDAGKVWYIDEETGKRNSISSMNDGLESCLEDDGTCTEPITVDGNTFRTIITVNDQLPGPTLIVHYNQIVSVNVINRLASEEVTVHWHGIHQINTSWMDGVHHVSQCGIAPGSTFRYIFRAMPAGTHWYHSHTGAQRTDGLFGALIIMENSTSRDNVMSKISPFIDMPGSHTLSFLDWQQTYSIELFTQIHSGIRYFTSITPPDDSTPVVNRTISTDGAEVGPVSFWSGLINGKGRHQDILYSKTNLSVFIVDYSETYRFRVIGAQSLFAFRVSVDGHKMKIIATDGHFVNPVTVDFLIVHSGERYDFLLETKPSTTNIKDFVIRGETLESNTLRDNVAEAILHYDSSTPEPQPTAYEQIVANSPRKSSECTTTNRCTALNCPFQVYPPNYYTDCISVDTLTLLNPLPIDSKLPNYVADQEIFLNFGFEGVGSTSAINSRNFKTPSAPPSLLNQSEFMNMYDQEVCKRIDDADICSTAPNQSVAPECFCVHMRNMSFNQSIQLVFSAVSPISTNLDNILNAHPIHLHGHSFHVVKVGFGKYDDNGMLTSASTDIECMGTDTCTVAQWKNNPLQGLSGKIPNNAPLKDTVLLPAGGYVIVYIQSTNPGFWLLHCHIEVHQLEGMAVIINEGYDQHNPPPEGMRQCGNFSWSLDDFNCKETGQCVVAPSLNGSFALGLYSNCALVLALLLIIVFFQ